MALGGNYNSQNNGNNGPNNPTYYSRLRIKNYENHTMLSFNYWKGTLKIIITEPSDNNSNSRPNELASIYMSPTKARILAEGVARIISSREDKVYGVDTGTGNIKGFIAIGRSKGDPFLFIGKVNADGKYELNQTFNFNTNSNFLFDVKDLANIKFQKEALENVELQEFMDLLNDYARAASGAIAASVHDINFYENNRFTGLVRSIANKVGAGNGCNNNGGGNNHFFDNANSEYSEPSHNSQNNARTNRYESIDDLEDALE